MISHRICRIAAPFALVFLALFALAATSTAQEIHRDRDGNFSTDQLEARTRIDRGQLLIIKSASTLRGEIVVRVDEEATGVEIIYFKKARAGNRSQAIDFIDLVGVTLSHHNYGAQLQLRAPNPAPWTVPGEHGAVEVQVIIPPYCSLLIEAARFDVSAEGPFGAVVIPASLGKIEVSDVVGRLEIRTANQKVKVSDISGIISVETSNATLTAVNIFATLKPGIFRNDRGNISITRYEGGLRIRNSYGRIDVTGFTPRGLKNNIRGVSEPIVIEIEEIADARLVVNNEFEDIDLILPGSLSASFSLAVEEGNEIEVRELEFITDLVEENRLYLLAGEGEASILAAIRGRGNIYVRGYER